MRQGGANSFFRFVLGFTLFISLSFCITYAVSAISVAQEKQKQTAAAFQIMLGKNDDTQAWWTFFAR